MESPWKSLTVPLDRVLEKIRPGMSIFLGSGAAELRTAIRYLLTHGKGRLEDLELIQLMSFGEAISDEARNAGHVRLKTFFSGWHAESAISDGRVDFIPCRFVHIPRLISSGLIHIDAAIVQITPPNEAGYCSLGVAVDAAREAMEQASLNIGEINPCVPFTLGDTVVPMSEFDLLTISEEPPLYFQRPETDALMDRIAFNAATLVEDESCVAFSTGPLFRSFARQLENKRHLGVHSPFFTDALMDLVNSGVVTNRRKETHRGKSLTSYAVGSKSLLNWLDHNPLVEFQSVDKVYSSSFIGRNPKFVALIPVRKVDLYGRIYLQSGESGLSIGSAEIMDLFNGTELSDGGHAIFALPSRYRDGHSNILLSIADHPNQFSLFESVRTVVTEYGIAHLEGCTVRERAQALIDIAHPDDRERLVNQAKAAHILYADQIFLAESGKLYPSEIAAEQATRKGLTVRYRAIKPSDEEGMRRLFYRFSDDSVYSRYFHSVRVMPHSKIQEYVNVDWHQVMSIIGMVREEGEERIIAEGRYIRIPGTENAEVVFVVDEDYQNQGIATSIYRMLVQLARERGIKTFLADVLFSNAPMMKVFHKGNLPVRAYLEAGTYHLSIDLK
ncbi:4-hydroxybutyrate coenzyme A transferase [Olavius algarvensis associated proteobacterium Delta 3]|nr:4-hydroxybutyrate coenzyme A transferase [Olavius algarvensis associated proteobacterium Delta 3]